MNLKHELTSYYIQNETELGKEETQNVLQILSNYDDNLSKLYPYDSMLLLRLVTDTILSKKVELITIPTPREYDTFKNL